MPLTNRDELNSLGIGTPRNTVRISLCQLSPNSQSSAPCCSSSKIIGRQVGFHSPIQESFFSNLRRSLVNSISSRSSERTISSDFSIEARNFPPSFFQRLTRSFSVARRRCFVSILSQMRHFWLRFVVDMTSFIPQVSPCRYSMLQCCRKWPHLWSPQAKMCWS